MADCVCLMGLGWGESVPVDTHVWQIAQRDYKFGKTKTKTFNKVMYDAVGDHFRGLWGKYAGWAHSVLFTADLREFSEQGVKKEESQVIKVKEEVIEKVDIPAEVLTRTRKRKTISTTETITKVKVEEGDDGTTIRIDETSKRRRTRGRP